MNDVVIRAHELTKVYRLYAGPGRRFLDMFGLLRHREGAYTEHAALDGISLEIKRGEKVAFIGRNGAGKSTLLKLLTGVIEPTSGTLRVEGKAHALLQIGSGFHPDFTGRENVYAYLAQLGVTGREADKKCAEIVEFAELEEYIGQPVKTYSSGMAVRLMFATSTAISPDLLVLDEVLGVGDAYFAQKSYERIRELCDAAGSTLLLVTHDVYSAVKLCNRVVWIERGRIVMDSEGPVVVKAYEDSIRQQEEHRLLLKKQASLRAAEEASAGSRQLIIELLARHNRPQPRPLFVSSAQLLLDSKVVAELEFGPGTPESGPGPHIVREGGCWGEARTSDGRPSLPLNNFGSPFHKAAFVLESPVPPAAIDPSRLAVRLTTRSDKPCDMLVRGFNDSRTIEFGPLPPSAGTWATNVVQGKGAVDESDKVNVTGAHGTGVFAIEGVELIGADGRPTMFVDHGAPATFAIDYRIQDPSFAGAAQVIVAVYKEGVQTACRFASDLSFDVEVNTRGRVSLDVERLNLGVGMYSLGVMIAEAGYLESEAVQFYTVSDRVYASLTRVLEFSVSGQGLLPTNTAWVGEGRWSIDAR